MTFRLETKSVLPPVKRNIDYVYLHQSGKDLIKVIVEKKSYLINTAELKNYLRGLGSKKFDLWTDYVWNFKTAVFDVVNDFMSYPKKDVRKWLKTYEI